MRLRNSAAAEFQSIQTRARLGAALWSRAFPLGNLHLGRAHGLGHMVSCRALSARACVTPVLRPLDSMRHRHRYADPESPRA